MGSTHKYGQIILFLNSTRLGPTITKRHVAKIIIYICTVVCLNLSIAIPISNIPYNNSSASDKKRMMVDIIFSQYVS